MRQDTNRNDVIDVQLDAQWPGVGRVGIANGCNRFVDVTNVVHHDYVSLQVHGFLQGLVGFMLECMEQAQQFFVFETGTKKTRHDEPINNIRRVLLECYNFHFMVMAPVLSSTVASIVSLDQPIPPCRFFLSCMT